MQLQGLHHVTAITANASRNMAFYTQVLGMRLVKKTVNQDDVSAYHLFYADALGSPGTDLTFFDWPDVAPNQNGAGSIASVALRVEGQESLAWWAKRFTGAGVPHSGVIEEDGRRLLRFADPEGLGLELAVDNGLPGGTPWYQSPVPSTVGIRGLHAVTLITCLLQPLSDVLTQVLGFHPVSQRPHPTNPERLLTVFAVGNGGPGAEVRVESGPDLPRGRQGSGGVHHVAFRTPNNEEQLVWKRRIAQAGLNVTPVIDRFYFKSIYFRIPEGILFEIATDGPGFTADEEAAHLGERLALPPFLEPHRASIEAHLHPL
jgi:glyoxalase family protein